MLQHTELVDNILSSPDRISLKEAGKLLSPDGVQVRHPDTIRAYVIEGRGGVHLKAARLGDSWATTRTYVREFAAELTQLSLAGEHVSNRRGPRTGPAAAKRLATSSRS